MHSLLGTDVFEGLLSRLLATSVQTVVLVALIWALCRWLPTLPAATRCRLWWLVAAQGVLGLLWAGAVHLPVLPATPASATVAAPVAMVATLPTPASRDATPPATGATRAAMQVNVNATVATAMSPIAVPSAPASAAALPWAQALVALWLAGVLVCSAHSVLAYHRSRQRARAAAPCTDAALLGALRLAAEAHGLRRPPQLRLCAHTDSPQLIGPWRPVLLLPARRMASLRADDLDMALTHELVHLQRRDLWWGLLPALAQHLFFFHPLVHLAGREYALAREAACDAAVVAGHRHCRHDYARLLVQLGVAPRPSAGLASASPTFLSLKRRLQMLQTTSAFPRLGAALILTAVTVLGVAPLRLVAQPGHAVAPAAKPGSARALAPGEAQAEAAADAADAAAEAAETAADAAAEAAEQAADAADAADADNDTAVDNGAGDNGAAARAANVPGTPLPPRTATTASSATSATSRRAPPPLAPLPPPAPPAPAVPAVPPVIASGISTRSMQKTRNGQIERSYVRIKGNSTTMRGSNSDLATAKAEVGSDGLWFSRGERNYVVRDPALLARFDALFEPMGKLGVQQGELGKRQGALGREQGELGRELGKLVKESVALAADRMDSKDIASKAQERAQAELARRQDALSAKMRALSAQQAALGRQQGELGTRQGELSAQADREADRLFDAAIAAGSAQRLE
ncbi:beta-lactamase regulating signal transducer with metallopeptidase domain [Xanthomonas sacchari]|uniref:M56 family metallopeptidase n=1 Tax=Xanthomonas sacchari TaxID=56458 RepID=UPI00278B78E7|nr:M56 family metallopeptidase [Xanthomonas sacchari]MDQ1091303.1 beta-lactamase regulating signal transducer with metallopeptidase domain [Xanthomonas sacchari]